MIITIDGPVGSGKSTVARRLAQRLSVAYLDTGAMYRAVALKAKRGGADPRDADELGRVVVGMDLRVHCGKDPFRIKVDGEDVTEEIRRPDISEWSSLVASAAPVREFLVALQRSLGEQLGSLVTEGRDQGSVVFPDADAKFYLTADVETRARRRHLELTAANKCESYESVLAGLQARDRRDSGRESSPLVRPDGAIEIDTTDLTIEQAVDRLVEAIASAT
jgi:cytidylate kinase